MASPNVDKLPSGRYRVRYTHNGRKTAPFTFSTKASANAWLRKTLSEIDKGTWIDPKAGQITFGDYASGWVNGRTDLSPRTQELYRQQIDAHLIPTFGELALSAISPSQVRAWRDSLPQKIVAQELTKPHPRLGVDGKTASAKCYRLFAQIMRLAVEEELISRSPCKMKGAGKEEAKERKTVSLTDLATLVTKIPERQRIILLLATWCQLRHGEILGLRRSSVDLSTGVLTIEETRPKLMDGRMIEKSPKTDASRRVIGIPPNILQQLGDHLETFVAPEPHDYLLTGLNGGPLHPGTFYKTWHKARLAIGRPELRLHDLRHTGLTLFALAGATTAELMYRAGHSSPTAAMRYQHANLQGDTARAKALAELDNVIPIGHGMVTTPYLKDSTESL